jgi:hypothetical protein
MEICNDAPADFLFDGLHDGSFRCARKRWLFAVE